MCCVLDQHDYITAIEEASRTFLDSQLEGAAARQTGLLK